MTIKKIFSKTNLKFIIIKIINSFPEKLSIAIPSILLSKPSYYNSDKAIYRLVLYTLTSLTLNQKILINFIFHIKKVVSRNILFFALTRFN
ncbi:hypothetical protein BH23BAC1_BH23BAC1_07140 [soil metagenome]